MIKVLCKPCLHAAANEAVADGIPLDDGSNKHYRTREQGRKADTHLVEDDTGEDEEEYEYVKECLCSLHRSESIGIPTALGLHKVLDRRQDVHEDVGAEHCQRQ